MADYKYSASSSDGKVKNGTLKASSQEEALTMLAAQSLVPLSIQSVEETTKTDGKKAKVKLIDKQIFFDHLSQMLVAGLSLTDILDALKDDTESKSFKVVIENLKYNIETGSTLSSGMAKYPKIFDNLSVKIIEIGEVSGTLSESAKQLAIQLKKSYELRAKVKGAMTYPAIILSMMLAIGTGLLVFVIPTLGTFFTQSNLKMPLTTQLLIDLSTFVKNDFFFIVIFIVGCIIGMRLLLRQPKIKRLTDRIILKTPIIGGISYRLNIVIFTRTLSSLLTSGVSITEALSICSEALSNSVYKDIALVCKNEVEKGVNLSDVMKKYPKTFSGLTVRMVAVGDKTGTTPQMLLNVSKFYQKQVDNTLGNISTIIEPIMMFIMGAGVLFLAVSVITPIYQLTSGISNSANQ